MVWLRSRLGCIAWRGGCAVASSFSSSRTCDSREGKCETIVSNFVTASAAIIIWPERCGVQSHRSPTYSSHVVNEYRPATACQRCDCILPMPRSDNVSEVTSGDLREPL